MYSNCRHINTFARTYMYIFTYIYIYTHTQISVFHAKKEEQYVSLHYSCIFDEFDGVCIYVTTEYSPVCGGTGGGWMSVRERESG